MKQKHFLKAIDHPRIVAAIGAAEGRTSGQIRVYISHRNVENALERARQRFVKLGMEKTAARNAVLLYFAPEARRYAVVGDRAIHECCGGDDFWRTLTHSTMRPLLKEERYTEAIVTAVEIVGNELAKYFPSLPGERPNELPDSVVED